MDESVLKNLRKMDDKEKRIGRERDHKIKRIKEDCRGEK